VFQHQSIESIDRSTARAPHAVAHVRARITAPVDDRSLSLTGRVMVHYVSRGAAATRADEATPLRGRDADADRASRTAHRARVAFGVGAAGLALVGLGSFTGALTERPTTTTTTMSLLGQGGSDLAPGTYLVQGGYQRQKNRAESAWCRWSDGNGYNGMNGFRCAGH